MCILRKEENIMKNFVNIILVFLAFLVLSCIPAMSQERTVNLAGGNNLVDVRNTKNVAYNGSASGLDRLIPTTRDTIDYYVILSNYDPGPLHFYAAFNFDTIAGVDTTVAITVQEKKFANEDYTDLIASAVTAGSIRNDTIAVRTSLGVTTVATNTTAAAVDIFRGTIIANNDTLTVAQRVTTEVANTLLYYRYLRFRLILQGNDSVGTGIKVKRVELQFYQ